MGIFSSIRVAIKKARTPEGMVFFRGEYIPAFVDEASLPDDFKTLYKMHEYYGYGHCPDMENRDRYHHAIIRKLYPMVRDGKGKDKYGRIEKVYFTEAGSQEEIDVYQFNKFCRTTENAFLTFDCLDDGRKDIDLGAGDGFLSGYGIENSMPYFRERMPDMINSVCLLLEKEKSPASLLHLGYFMYHDIMNYLKAPGDDKSFTFKERRENYLWKKAYPYLWAAYEYYGYILKDPERKYSNIALAKKAEFDKLNEEALYNASLCSKEELLRACGVAVEERRRDEVRIHHADSSRLQNAKNMYHGINYTAEDKAKANAMFEEMAAAGDPEATFYVGLYHEHLGNLPKAEGYFCKAIEMGCISACKHIADREYANHRNRELVDRYYRKVLSALSERDESGTVKTVIARIIEGCRTSDLDENTLGLCVLAMDYARLDAPIVREKDLLSLLEGVKNSEYKAVDELVYYYSEYSRGRMAMGTIKGSEIFETDLPRAMEMRQIARAFGLMKISMLLSLANENPDKYLVELAQAYFDLENMEKTEKYVELGLRLNIPSMQFFVYHNARRLGYEEWQALDYLKKSAAMGYRPAIHALDDLHYFAERDRERAEWISEHMPVKTRQDYAGELELLEREINIMLGGDGSDVDEMALSGRLSFADASLLRHYKNKLLEKYD